LTHDPKVAGSNLVSSQIQTGNGANAMLGSIHGPNLIMSIADQAKYGQRNGAHQKN